MKVRMLRNLGRNLVALAPEAEKVIAAALAEGKGFAEGQIRDVSAAEAEFLKKHKLAEDVTADESSANTPAALAQKAARVREQQPG